MTGRIAKSVFMIALVVLATTSAATQALFTDTVFVGNNTFSTGTLALKLFYDCEDPLVTETSYVSPVNPVTSIVATNDNAVIVDCPAGAVDGAGERAALAYAVVDGATFNNVLAGDIFNLENDWTTTNGWWDALSSPFDSTNMYPGYSTYAAGATGGVDPSEGTMLTLGNAGTITMGDISMVANYEAADADEIREPLDGVLPGGASIDPLVDADWVGTVGKVYDTSLGQVIDVIVQRVDNAEAVLDTVYSGTFDGLVTAGARSLFLTTAAGLNQNEVTYLRFNWSMQPGAGNAYQGLLFDYTIDFTATQ